MLDIRHETLDDRRDAANVCRLNTNVYGLNTNVYGLKSNILSSEAQTVYDAGLELWKYYHEQPHANPDASFYDIRRHFQGTDANGRMNNDSADARYTELISDLREKQKRLAKKIEECVYKYGFLK